MLRLLEKLLMVKDLDPRPSLGSARDPTGERGVVPVDTKLLADIEASLAALTALKALTRASWPPLGLWSPMAEAAQSKEQLC